MVMFPTLRSQLRRFESIWALVDQSIVNTATVKMEELQENNVVTVQVTRL
jgi:hypothetical protein